MKTFPTPHAVALLVGTGIVGTNVDTQSRGAATQLPGARVTLLTDTDPDAPWVRAVFQVDVWATTDAAAGRLAWDLANAYDRIPAGDATATTYRESAWVISWPRPINDPDTTAARYLFEVGLVLSTQE